MHALRRAAHVVAAVWCSVFASFSLAQQPQLDVFFAPYDASTPAIVAGESTNLTALQTDIALILNITAAKQAYDSQIASSNTVPDVFHDDPIPNPFVVQFCVYNLLDTAYLDPLIAAWKAGVFVQVIMDHSNLQEKYVPTWQIFHDAGMNVSQSSNVTQRDLSLEEKLSLNLIGADVGSLMHMKLRYFRWLDQPGATASEVVVTGSLNPEQTATENDDTLVVFRDAPEEIQRYRNATADVLEITHAANAYDANRSLNIIYSQAEVSKGTEQTALARRVLLSLVRTEEESILISVYSLRSLEDGKGPPLVESLCAARERGVGVAVITDKGQSDGEAGFAGGDDSTTAWRLTQCGIPTYKAKNYNSHYTALHHKNAVFGAGHKRLIVWTDTANWSKASMGNGTRDTKPSNAETSLVIDSLALDNGRTGYRFISNFLQLLRDYEYQQACPYIYNGRTEHANCATDEPFNQPNWTQPGARNVSATLTEAPGVVAAGGWPSVATTFSVSNGDPGTTSLHYSVNGGADRVAQLHASPSGGLVTDSISLPFGGIVDWSLAAGNHHGTTSLRNGDNNKTSVVVDAAFDWNSANKQRRPNSELDSMTVHIPLA